MRLDRDQDVATRIIEEARARALKAGNEAIKDTEKRIAEGEKRRAALNQEAEFYKKTAMPAKLKQDLQNNENELKNQQELLDVKKKEIGLINAKYDEDKRRFDQTLDKDEQFLRDRHQATLEFLNWRRFTIKNKFLEII